MTVEILVSDASVRSCACGAEHLAVVLGDGSLFTWGRKVSSSQEALAFALPQKC